MNLSQLAESDARREEAQLRVRHHAALIAGIVCRIWQGRTRIGDGCLHIPHQVVPGTFVDYAYLFFLLSASGGWVKIKLDLHLRTRVGYVLCTTYVQPRISSYVPGTWCEPDPKIRICRSLCTRATSCSLCQTIWTRGLPTRDSSSITGLVLDKSFP